MLWTQPLVTIQIPIQVPVVLITLNFFINNNLIIDTKMLAFMILGLISVGQGLPSMSTGGTVPCESPTPESIAPCTCE